MDSLKQQLSQMQSTINNRLGDSMKKSAKEMEQAVKDASKEMGDSMDDTAKGMEKSVDGAAKSMEESFDGAGKSMAKSMETSNNEIKAILEDTERTAKSKAASIAAIYKKEGMSSSDAMKKAWGHIERDSPNSKSKTSKGTDGVRDASFEPVVKKTNSIFSNFFNKVKKDSKDTSESMKNSFSSGFDSITGFAKKASGIIAAAFATGKIVEFGKECIELGSDLSEVQNVVDVTFLQMRQRINEFAQSADKNFGLSETMAKQYAGTLGAMAKAFGFTEQEAATMSTTLTGLAGDVASFYNISQDEAFKKLKSVFTGETESLKDLGIVMTQTALHEFALSQGISKTTSDMTEAEKVALRYKFVLQQLDTASGDFARTSDGWANQMRILNLQFDSFKANIGQGLINLLTPAIKAINTLMEKLVQLSAKFKEFTELITGKTPDSGGTGSTASELAGIKDSADDVKDSAKKAKEEIRSLMGFDQINKLSDTEEEKDTETDIGSGLGSAAGQADKTGSAIDKLKDKLKSLFDLFKNGFDLGFADADLENLLKQARRVRDALEAIFTDPRVVNSAKRLGTQIVEALGVITGSIARVAVEWGAAILEGVANSLEKNKEYIVTTLVSIMDNVTGMLDELGQIFLTLADILTAPEVLESLANLSESITTCITTFTLETLECLTAWGLAILEGIHDSLEEMKGTIEERFSSIMDNCSQFLDDLSETFMSLGEIFTAPDALESLRSFSSSVTTIFTDISLTAIDILTKFATDVLELITSPINDNKDKIKEAWEGVCEIVANVTETIKDAVKELCDKVEELYDEHIHPFMQSLEEGISEICGTLLDGWNTYVKPVLDSLAEKFDKVVKEHVVPMLKKAIDVIGNVFDVLTKLWDKILKPIVQFIVEKMMPIIAKLVEVLGGTLLNAIAFVSDAFNVVLTVVNGIIDAIGWLVDKLSGAASAVKNFFSGFDNDTSVGISVPHLAEGGYVKANTPRLAMIGDNSQYGEIVAPENKLQEMANKAAGSGNAEMLALLRQLVEYLKNKNIVELDAESLRRYFIEKTNQRTMQTGEAELIF